MMTILDIEEGETRLQFIKRAKKVQKKIPGLTKLYKISGNIKGRGNSGIRKIIIQQW